MLPSLAMPATAMSAAKRRSAGSNANANAAPAAASAAAAAAVTKARVLLVARDRDGTPIEYQLLATSPADVFAWVRTRLHLDAHAFALLCDGMLLAANTAASALPRPATASTPLRIDLLRYHEPAADDDDANHESDFDVEDQDDLDPAATDINDDVHAAVLLTLVEMFPDLPARALADIARVCGTQIDDAVDMAMALFAVDDDDTASASPSATSSSSSSLATNSSTSSSPPASAPAGDAWHAATAARHKTRRRKKPPLAPPASPALTREVAALLDLFPHVPAATLATHLARHANDVQAAAESLLANPPPPAQPACDGACIDAGFPCLDHGSLLPGPPSSAAIARAAPPPLPAPTPRDPRLDALRDLFPNRSVAELRAALRAAGGDSASAAAALLGDPVAGSADVPGDDRPSWARAVGADDEDGGSRRTSKAARAARPATASVNAFEALASPKDARRVASEHGFTRVTAKKNKGKNPTVPGTRAVTRREREYRSEAAIKAETTVLDPLPIRRRAATDGPSAASAGLGPAPQRASVSSAAAAMEAKLGALYAARADRFAAAARAVKSKAKYGRVGGEVATVLADHGHELTAAIRSVERDQALAIVQARQETTRAARDAQRQHVAAMANDGGNTLRWASYVPQSVGDIHADLHGLTVFQARAAVPFLVHDWYERETRAHPRPQRPLFLVVGLGKHSSGQHKLGPAVLSLVRRMGFRFVDETQQFGRIVVVDAAAGGPVPLEDFMAGGAAVKA
ncbi:hypothetical protein AMAG_10100 [Allomyces macrogynus ATCC 38327]|uniref:Smr domain-containing protein n=1 Tax=Allomyces macrogynus (strain ATCC 38327) TaxID=578462 RepID=A0A0L0SQW3_ALLM3|nr:hypothetical protein AMAG_10100 [Allomyces macrogynus ATCC 38327]|eukprot:KNE64750.1 hypothetical protein AMAG_10100 [Allomyces macrogynus ATCC 38327]